MLFLARTESVNKKIKLHSSDIRGTNYGEKVAHRKILEWQVINKNINNSAMEHIQQLQFSFIQERRLVRLNCD